MTAKQANTPEQLAAKKRLLEIMAAAGLTGLGGGIAWRSLKGFGQLTPGDYTADIGSQLADDVVIPSRKKPLQPITVDALPKVAADNALSQVLSRLAKYVPDSFVPITTPGNVGSNWSALGLGLPLLAGAGYTGYALADNAIDKKRQMLQKAERSEAEKEYYDALKLQYAATLRAKKGSHDDTLASSLDALFEQYVEAPQGVKQATGRMLNTVSGAIGDTFEQLLGGAVNGAGNVIAGGTQAMAGALQQSTAQAANAIAKSPMANQLAGLYLATVLGMTGAGGAMGYRWQRARHGDKLLNEALLRRRHSRTLLQPVEATTQELTV